MEWYRWNNLEDAQEALDYINNRPELPHVGRNAATGEISPDKCQTIKWCDSVTECTDGKFGFPRISETWLDELGVDETTRDQFITYFVTNKDGGVIEEFDPEWIANPTEVDY